MKIVEVFFCNFCWKTLVFGLLLLSNHRVNAQSAPPEIGLSFREAGMFEVTSQIASDEWQQIAPDSWSAKLLTFSVTDTKHRQKFINEGFQVYQAGQVLLDVSPENSMSGFPLYINLQTTEQPGDLTFFLQHEAVSPDTIVPLTASHFQLQGRQPSQIKFQNLEYRVVLLLKFPGRSNAAKKMLISQRCGILTPFSRQLSQTITSELDARYYNSLETILQDQFLQKGIALQNLYFSAHHTPSEAPVSSDMALGVARIAREENDPLRNWLEELFKVNQLHTIISGDIKEDKAAGHLIFSINLFQASNVQYRTFSEKIPLASPNFNTLFANAVASTVTQISDVLLGDTRIQPLVPDPPRPDAPPRPDRASKTLDTITNVYRMILNNQFYCEPYAENQHHEQALQDTARERMTSKNTLVRAMAQHNRSWTTTMTAAKEEGGLIVGKLPFIKVISTNTKNHEHNILYLNSEVSGPVSYTGAQKKIQKLNAEHSGGFSDWRLPSIEELLYIFQYDVQPNRHGFYFPMSAWKLYPQKHELDFFTFWSETPVHEPEVTSRDAHWVVQAQLRARFQLRFNFLYDDTWRGRCLAIRTPVAGLE